MKKRTPASIRPPLVAGFVSVTITLLVFFPAITGTYGIYDAVRLSLDFGWLGESRLMGVILGGGRFVYAWLAAFGFSHAPYIEDLWFLRTVGILGLALAAWAISSHARKAGWGFFGSVCLAVLAVANPGTAPYGFWSACFPFGYAILIAFYAGCLWDEDRWARRFVSMLLLQLAFAIYQPAALFFFTGPFISWFGPDRHPARPFRALWCFQGLVLGMAIHLVLARISLQVFPEAIAQQDRLIDGGLLASVMHVGVSVIPRILSTWGGLLPGHWVPGLWAFSLVGIVLFLIQSRGIGDRLLRVLSILVVALTFVPAVVSADHYTPYRLLAPAFCGIWIIVLAGFHQLLAKAGSAQAIVSIALALFTAGFAAYAIRFGIVQPRNLEHTLLSEAFAEMGPDSPPDGLFVIRPDGTAPIDQHILQKAEYGAYELTYGGFSEAYLSLIAAEVYGWKPGKTYPLNRVHWIFYPPEVKALPVFYPLLDLRVLLQGRDVEAPVVDQGIAARHPYLGETLFFKPSLYLSSKIGLIQQEGNGWFFKPGRGWMQWESEPGEVPVKVKDVSGRIISFPTPFAE